MTPASLTPPPRPSLIARFGPLAAVLVALGLVAAFASTGRNEVAAAIGGFYKGGKPKSNTKPDPGIVQKGDESKTGGLTFKLPAGAQPDYLEFKCDAGTTRKYLP